MEMNNMCIQGSIDVFQMETFHLLILFSLTYLALYKQSRSVIRLLGSIALDMPIDLCSYFMLPESVVRKACHRIFFQRSVVKNRYKLFSFYYVPYYLHSRHTGC
uniref:Uncharacterized protein n=1 Tax=Wuchereria bancrofti TaxID=6293 RepID=A0A1I8EJS8_WUCBA